MNKFGLLFLVLFVLCVSHIPSSLAANRFNLINTQPVADGGPFFAAQASDTLTPGQWTAGSSLSYGYLPLRGTAGGANTNIVENLFWQDFFGAVGLFDWLSVSANLPVTWANIFSDPDTLSAASTKSTLSDIVLSSKVLLLNKNKHNFGIALAPFITLPTGDEATFAGDEGVSGGVKAIFDGAFGRHVTWAVNTGFLAREDFNTYGLTFGDQFLFSAGLNLKASDALSLVGEADIKTDIDNFFGDKDSTPMQTRTGIQWRFGKEKNYIINGAGTFGVTYGSGTPHYGALLGFAYKAPVPKPHKSRHAVTKEIQQKIYFSSNSSRLTVNGKRRLDSIATILSANKWIKQVTLIGHADRFGNSTYNEDLSLRRARAVQKHLFEQITRSIEIRVQGVGENTERCVEISL